MFLTHVDVGVKSQSAVLYIEGEGVDIEVTGADNSDWRGIMHPPVTIQVHIWNKGGCVFIHTAKQEVRVRGNSSSFDFIYFFVFTSFFL